MNFAQVDRMASSPAPALPPYAQEGRGSTAVARSETRRRVNPDVAEFLLLSSVRRRRGSRKPAPAQEEAEVCEKRRALYDCVFEEEAEDGGAGRGKFAPSRLVWAKVKTHPWLPAQVFDAADASELARRHRGARDTTLVAFFWDMTFAWAAAYDLRPFRDGFPLLAGKRSAVVASAVDAALAEVARRVGAGLSCACSPGEKQHQVVANAGVREGARGAAAVARAAFRDEAFVEYVSALAAAPVAGADRLELTIAMAQLSAFNRWRGGAPVEYTATFGIVDDGVMEAATTAPESRATTTPKRRRRRRRARRGGAAASGSGDASAGDLTMSRCARGTTVATMTRDDGGGAFRGKALVEHVLALPAGAGAPDKRDLAAAAAAAQLNFNQWRRAPSRLPDLNIASNGDTEAATPPASLATAEKKNVSIGGADAAAADRAGAWRMTSCIVSRKDSAACEIDDHHDALEERQLDDLEPFSPDHPSHQISSKLGWKDYVIVMQFVAIILLVCKLIQSH